MVKNTQDISLLKKGKADGLLKFFFLLTKKAFGKLYRTTRQHVGTCEKRLYVGTYSLFLLKTRVLSDDASWWR